MKNAEAIIRLLILWLNKPLLKGLLGLVLLISMLRLLPYFAPIRAKDLVQDRQAIEFRDRSGLFLGTILTRDQEHTAAVPLDQVSPHFIHAILAAEDSRFYHHGPLDLRAIARSALEALQAGQIVSGASTVTMQLARMLEPVPNDAWGKVREIWLAWRLAAGMSKDEILEAYLNRLPMGGNIYGVEASARVYFGVSAQNLTVAQASLLAGLPNNPTALNPYLNTQGLKRRQGYVLSQMVKDNYLTRAQADRIRQEEVVFQLPKQGILAAPHFLFWVASQLPSQHPAQIQTTLDLPLQEFVEAQVQQAVRSLAQHNVHHGAALVIDNRSGQVLAYVGSPDYFLNAQLGQNDGVQALRQPGSALKPFLYALALEKRVIRPNTILQDVPTYYAIPGAKLYSPTDYSETFEGPVRVRVALANSLNVPAVRVLEKVGVPVFLDWLHRLGFQHLNQSPEYYGLGLALGSGEVSLWELARAYLAIATQGSPPALSVVETDAIERPQMVVPSGDPAAWTLLADILGDRYARARAFGVESVLNLPFSAAVKTGTSSNYRDTWTAGFTTDYTVATWVGNFNGEPMEKVTGVSGAAPLWHRIMLHLHEHREPTPFPSPAGMVKRSICASTGWKPTADCPSVVQEYFDSNDLLAYERPQQLSASKGQSAGGSTVSAPNSALKILFPHEGDYFLINLAAKGDAELGRSQKLEFKVSGLQKETAVWKLNGKVLPKQPSGSFFWPLRVGQWKLQVQNGAQVDEVNFEVGLSPAKTQQRGFSIPTGELSQ